MATGTLIKLGGNLENPRDSKPSDYPAVGPMGAAGMAEGAGKLVPLSELQEGPRHNADSGEQTPSVWGKAGTLYTVEKNKGEGGMASTAVSIKGSLNLETGQMEPNAKEQTY